MSDITDGYLTVEVPMTDIEARVVIALLYQRALRVAKKDRDILDRIILLHQPSEPDRYDGSVDCTGCFGEWPCTTQQELAKWGQP